MSSSTPVTSIWIVTELLRITNKHVKVSRLRVADIVDIVEVLEQVEP